MSDHNVSRRRALETAGAILAGTVADAKLAGGQASMAQRPVAPRIELVNTLEYEEEAELHEAGAVIANSYLRLDHQEWIRVVEKRSAALADRDLGQISLADR